MTPRRPLREHLAPVRAPSWDAVERAVTRRRRARVAALALAPACALALLVLARRPAPQRPHAVATAPERVAVGADLREGATVLSDRSRIDVARGAALRLVSRDERAYVFALLSGTASFEVTPGGPRRWRVDAGLATVTVVGTGFTVARAPDRVRVSVRHGAVRVESALLAEGSALLRDGASLDLRAPPDAPPRVAQPMAHDAGVARAQRAALRRVAPPDAGAPSALLPPRDAGVTSPPTATDEAVEALWSRADVLRRARAFAASCALLEEIATSHPASPRAPLAALMLGRDRLHALQRPAEAARAYARAIALGLPESLREDAWLGLVEARWQPGDRAGAEEAARAYRARFPRGVHRAYIERLLGDGP